MVDHLLLLTEHFLKTSTEVYYSLLFPKMVMNTFSLAYGVYTKSVRSRGLGFFIEVSNVCRCPNDILIASDPH